MIVDATTINSETTHNLPYQIEHSLTSFSYIPNSYCYTFTNMEYV